MLSDNFLTAVFAEAVSSYLLYERLERLVLGKLCDKLLRINAFTIITKDAIKVLPLRLQRCTKGT